MKIEIDTRGPIQMRIGRIADINSRIKLASSESDREELERRRILYMEDLIFLTYNIDPRTVCNEDLEKWRKEHGKRS